MQGKEKDSFILYYLEPEILSSFSYSYPEAEIKPHIGVDESGKGDFFGPLCIAGVYGEEKIIKKLISLGVKDSKKISDQTIEKIAPEIRRIAPHHLLFLPPDSYNRLYQSFRNLNRLLAWGHSTVIKEMVQKTGCTKVLVDQFTHQPLIQTFLDEKAIDLELKTHAESDLVVAAASILARSAFIEGLKRVGDQVGRDLPKGAGEQVIKAGQQLIAQHQSVAVLEKCSKKHFSTYKKIIESSSSG